MSKIWIAFSGGVDSVVLLHFLATHFPHLTLHAVHINHQLFPESSFWEKHCKRICNTLHVPLKIIRVSINKQSGKGLEAASRHARYASFTALLKKDDMLITAHHMDDQAETLLLQLFRGAGLRGTSAMPTISKLGKGYLVRPLLHFTRDDLVFYAHYHHLEWVEDPSNQDQTFDRNFLRYTVMPVLKNRWPHAHKTLARFAKHFSEQEHLLQIYAAEDYQDCHGQYLNTLFIPSMMKMDKPRQQNVLRYFIGEFNLPRPPKKLLLEIQRNIFQSRRDANPIIHWKNVSFRRFREHLFILFKGGKRKGDQPVALTNLTPDEINTTRRGKRRGDRLVALTKLTPDEIKWCEQHLPYQLDNPKITIQFRHGGERFKPENSKHSRTLKNLFQEWEIPPWQRNHIPLVYYNKKLIAIVGFAKGNTHEPSDD